MLLLREKIIPAASQIRDITSFGLSTLSFRLWIPVFILLCSSAAAPAEDIATDPEAFSGIYVKAAESEYDYDTQEFRAEGNAFVRYNDVSLTADLVIGNAGTGDFEARGNVTFTQGERAVKGSSFLYNYKTRMGHSTDASASADGIYFHGKALDSKPDGYSLTSSTFTTCDREKPHYYLSARELIIRPGDKLIARGVKFVALGRTLLTLPKYTVGLEEGKRSGTKLPSLGLSGKYGTFIAHSLDFSSEPGLTGELAVRLSTAQTFQGSAEFSRVANRPMILNLSYREPYYGGRSPDTMLSRLPELAYRFYSKGTPALDGRRDDSLNISRTVLDPTSETESRGLVHMVGEAGAGKFKEDPSGVQATRLDLRAMAWLDPIHLGGALVMPGLLARLSHYSTGDNYTGLGFQLAAAQKLGPKSYISLIYVTHAITGSTPFDFDPVEAPRELAGRLHFPIGDYAIELGMRYDLQSSRMFDSEISVSKVFHCVEPKFIWRNRFQEFSFNIGLAGF